MFLFKCNVRLSFSIIFFIISILFLILPSTGNTLQKPSDDELSQDLRVKKAIYYHFVYPAMCKNEKAMQYKAEKDLRFQELTVDTAIVMVDSVLEILDALDYQKKTAGEVFLQAFSVELNFLNTLWGDFVVDILGEEGKQIGEIWKDIILIMFQVTYDYKALPKFAAAHVVKSIYRLNQISVYNDLSKGILLGVSSRDIMKVYFDWGGDIESINDFYNLNTDRVLFI